MRTGASLAKFLSPLYGSQGTIHAEQVRRWERLVEAYRLRFGESGLRLFSAPGRVEICGNHTDHNGGKVLAAAVNLDSIAVACASSDGRITVDAQNYSRPFVVELADLAPVPQERGSTAALIRGIARGFREEGYSVGGFCACFASDVPVGSGLSSSASIEMLVGTILNSLYNGGTMDAHKLAVIGQYAENEYFGKPCGLMDQLAIATGGIVSIDFVDPQSPSVETIDFDFTAAGYSILVIDTGGSHADLTVEYAAIPLEMKSVAEQFGHMACREITEEGLLGRISELRDSVGDRAVLRALHFLEENRRVDFQVEALRRHDMPAFLRLVEESGQSSFCLLQNCCTGRDSREQGIPLALALSGRCVRTWGGACRVHGGGFAGTVLVFLPIAHGTGFQSLMESVFGAGCVKCLHVRRWGAIELA